MRPFWRHYYAGTSGIIFVVDSQDAERLSKASQELHGLLKEEELEFATLVVVANKQDMKAALSIEKIYAALDLDVFMVW